jgi:hypothetical protein
MRGEIGRYFVFSCSDGKYLMTTVPYSDNKNICMVAVFTT